MDAWLLWLPAAVAAGARVTGAAAETKAWHRAYLGVSQNLGYHFGGPYNKDDSIWGSLLGSPYFGKLPFNAFLLGTLLDLVVSSLRRGHCHLLCIVPILSDDP